MRWARTSSTEGRGPIALPEDKSDIVRRLMRLR
jgi:hypothetical protein